MFAIAGHEVFDETRQHFRNLFKFATQIPGLLFVKILPSMSNRDVRSNLVCRSASDEEVPRELPIALLSKSLRDIRWNRCRGRG